jgi:hypothetical protein
MCLQSYGYDTAPLTHECARYTFLDKLGLVTRMFLEEERRAVMNKISSM